MSDGVYAAGIGTALAGFSAIFGQSPADAFGWMAQLGPAAGAAVVAYVAFVYVRKRDEDAKINMDRQEAQAKENREAVNRLYDRVETMGRENRDALTQVVGKMENAIRDNAQSHSNGLAQVSASINLMINTVTTFQRTQDELAGDMEKMREDVAMVVRLAGIRTVESNEPTDPTRSDSKQVKIPKLPKHKEGA